MIQYVVVQRYEKEEKVQIGLKSVRSSAIINMETEKQTDSRLVIFG